MYRQHRLSYLVRYEKREAEKIIREAFRDAGELQSAAVDLGISERTLQRYLRTLGIWDSYSRSLKNCGELLLDDCDDDYLSEVLDEDQ